MSGTRILTIAGGGHEPADPRAFEDALQELEAPRIEADDIAACRERRARSIAREAAAVEQLVDAGRLDLPQPSRHPGRAAGDHQRVQQRVRRRAVGSDREAGGLEHPGVERLPPVVPKLLPRRRADRLRVL